MDTRFNIGRAARFGVAGLAVLAAGAFTQTAMADITGPGLTVRATDNLGNEAIVTINGQWNAEGTAYTWENSSTIEMWDGDVLVGTINPLDELGRPTVSAFVYYEDPVIQLNFAVQAGSAAVTNFTISSALLSFPTMSNPIAAASAAYSVTDGNNNTAALVGQGPTGGAYLAQYNGYAGTFSGTTYLETHNNINVGTAFGTTTATTNYPVSGYNVVAGNVSDMSASIQFSLTRFDQASGTTSYVMLPEPSTFALLVFGLIGFRRR